MQDLRKTAGFDISDRIRIAYTASPDLAAAAEAHAGYIQAETLAVSLEPGAAPDGAATAEDSFDGETLSVAVLKAS